MAAFPKRVLAAVMLFFGVLLCAVAILILALALFATIIGWEWIDGPIIWERVIGIVFPLVMIGVLLISVARAITATRGEDLK